MGTNYYLHRNACECCGRSEDRVHIGKSSYGWCFSLHVDKWEGANNLEEWQEEWKKGVIVDEYGQQVSPEEMLETITQREGCNDFKKPYPLKHDIGNYGSWEDFHARNYSEPGPKGLLRHQIKAGHCIGHGDGTYDLIVGEFS